MIKNLKNLGLSDNEAKVYLSMLELGPSSVLEISAKAGVNRPTTYVQIETLKKMGLVSQVFNEEALKSLDGDMSLGHVRYSTTGHSHVENAQPVEFKLYGHDAVLGHNGNLVNYLNLKNELEAEGYTFSMSSDTEVIAALLQKISKTEPDLEKNIMQVCGRLQGAFSLVLMTQHKLFAMRDPHGIRPLSIGRFGKNFVLSSETAAMDIIGAEFMREVERGELVVIDEAGLRSQIYNNEERSAHCWKLPISTATCLLRIT
jgi:amidophosphoribosyltransferase